MARVSRARLVSAGLALLLLVSAAVSAETPARAIASAVQKPMLFVARLIEQEKLRPNIDEMLQNAPSAKDWARNGTRRTRPGRRRDR